MPLALDDLLGACYIDPQDFLDRAAFFGAQVSIQGKTADDLKPLAALASRAIDAHCKRSFTPDSIIEIHKWVPRTRRISVNQPPVMTLEEYKIITAPGQSSAFDVGTVLINNQENYLELASLAVAGSLVTTTIALGVTEAQVQVKYKSFSAVPQKVIAACGFTMAKMANEAYASSQIPDGITRVKTTGLDVTRKASVDDTRLLPPIAETLLQSLTPIVVG